MQNHYTKKANCRWSFNIFFNFLDIYQRGNIQSENSLRNTLQDQQKFYKEYEKLRVLNGPSATPINYYQVLYKCPILCIPKGESR